MAYIISSQPQATTRFLASSSQWHSEMFACCDDMEICLCGTFVPCVLACKIASEYGECCCLPLAGDTLIALRTGIRERYRIPGSILADYTSLACFPHCALCQMARELQARK